VSESTQTFLQTILFWFAIHLRFVQRNDLIVAERADFATIMAKAPEAYDRLSFFDVAKLKSMLRFGDRVHFGSSVFSRVNDLVQRIKPTIDFS
tara:strand:- start:322 stop:600 length:279 start_codon:yes stop_codon:yes gene_type:complete